MTPSGQLLLTQFLDAWLGAHAASGGQPGFSVVIRHNGQEVYARAFGYNNLEQAAPLTLDNLFNIGSQSKMMTALLCMQLVEHTILSLDKAAAHYLPWLAEHPDTRVQFITVRQLLWHGSGLVRDGANADYWLLRRPFPTVSDIKQTILQSTLISDKAVKLKYSNIGYALLGLIIEAVTGQSYAREAEKRIIRPLNLQHTYPDCRLSIKSQIATGYTRRLSATRAVLPRAIATNAFTPVTGWYASTRDVATLAEAVGGRNSPLLGNALQEEMLYGNRNHWLGPTEQGTRYGLGVMHYQREDGGWVLGHGGAFIGHQTCSYIDPEHELVVAVAANAKDTPVNHMAFGIFEVLAYFRQHTQTTVPANHARFTMALRNIFSTRYILAIGDRIVSVPLDDWAPFEAMEQLEVIDANTLRIVSADDLSSEGETITLYRTGDEAGTITRVNYAGLSMWPVSLT